MASKVNAAKIAQTSKLAMETGCAYYKQLLEKNKQYIKDPPTVENCKKLSNQLFYTRLASIPGRCEAFWNEFSHLKHLMKNRQELKIEHAGLATLFGLETFFWFTAGKIVGRGFTLTGYDV